MPHVSELARHFFVGSKTHTSLPGMASTSMINTAFQYKPLNLGTNEIRLMRLLPKQESSAAQPDIECEIYHANLEDGPQYEALSYVWGSTSKPFSILADGKRLAVTSNLYIALQFLRADLKGPKTYWIDSICIDQSSGLERNHQVSMMKDIFSQAARTTVWLGDQSFDALEEASNFLKFVQSDRSASSPSNGISSNSKASMYQNATKLLHCSWFTRIWVVQELVLSRKVIVRAGMHEMGWDALVAAMGSVVHATYWDSDRGGISVQADRLAHHSHNLFVLDRRRNRDRDIDTRNRLLYLVFALQNFECTEDLDKVYAIAGIAARSNGQKSETFLIEYGISFEEMAQRLFVDHSTLTRADVLRLISAGSYHEGIKISVPTACVMTMTEHSFKKRSQSDPFQQDHRIITPHPTSVSLDGFEFWILRAFVIIEYATPLGWMRLAYATGMFFLLVKHFENSYFLLEALPMSPAASHVVETLSAFGFMANQRMADGNVQDYVWSRLIDSVFFGNADHQVPGIINGMQVYKDYDEWGTDFLDVNDEESAPYAMMRSVTGGQKGLWEFISTATSMRIVQAGGTLVEFKAHQTEGLRITGRMIDWTRAVHDTFAHVMGPWKRSR